MAKNPKWTEAQLDIVRKHYLSDGTKYCAKILGKTEAAVHHKSEQLRILVARRSFDIESFRNVRSPEVAYILGMLWADGYVSLKECKAILNLVKVDLDEIVPLFMKTGEWSYFSTKKLCKRCTNFQASIRCYNGELIKFLETLDYRIKSGTSASKVLKHIPNHLKHYWWRGYFDGDGCLAMNSRLTRGGNVVFSSSYNQDWSFVEELMKKLSISKFNIRRRVVPNENRYSCFCVYGNDNIVKLMSFIYDDRENDNIGLSRKFQKWKEFLKKPIPYPRNKPRKDRPLLYSILFQGASK